MAPDTDAEVMAAAKVFGMGETLFKNIPLGARFVFSMDHADKPYAILVRTKGGYRHEVGGRQFTTGARTACFVL